MSDKQDSDDAQRRQDVAALRSETAIDAMKKLLDMRAEDDARRDVAADEEEYRQGRVAEDILIADDVRRAADDQRRAADDVRRGADDDRRTADDVRRDAGGNGLQKQPPTPSAESD